MIGVSEPMFVSLTSIQMSRRSPARRPTSLVGSPSKKRDSAPVGPGAGEVVALGVHRRDVPAVFVIRTSLPKLMCSTWPARLTEIDAVGRT